MDIRLTWKHALAAALVVAALAGLVMWYVNHVDQQQVVDAERQALIEQLEEENETLLDQADRAHDDADEARKIRDGVQSDLDRAQAALAAMQNRAIGRPVTRAGCVEERDTLREINEALVVQNHSLLNETLNLRQETVLLRRVIDNHRERDILKDKRYDSLKRSQKKQRRKSIWTAVGTNLGSFTFGFGMGRVSS